MIYIPLQCVKQFFFISKSHISTICRQLVIAIYISFLFCFCFLLLLIFLVGFLFFYYTNPSPGKKKKVLLKHAYIHLWKDLEIA